MSTSGASRSLGNIGIQRCLEKMPKVPFVLSRLRLPGAQGDMSLPNSYLMIIVRIFEVPATPWRAHHPLSKGLASIFIMPGHLNYVS